MGGIQRYNNTARVWLFDPAVRGTSEPIISSNSSYTASQSGNQWNLNVYNRTGYVGTASPSLCYLPPIGAYVNQGSVNFATLLGTPTPATLGSWMATYYSSPGPLAVPLMLKGITNVLHITGTIRTPTVATATQANATSVMWSLWNQASNAVTYTGSNMSMAPVAAHDTTGQTFSYQMQNTGGVGIGNNATFTVPGDTELRFRLIVGADGNGSFQLTNVAGTVTYTSTTVNYLGVVGNASMQLTYGATSGFGNLAGVRDVRFLIT